nr:MAG TPA: hypothetical protein [Bacteriophage sp.]
MKQDLINELSKFGYPVFLQGSLNEDDAYPDSFITFWTDDVTDEAHYDDDATAWAWDFSVIFYSNDPVLVNSKPEEIRKALKAAGFIPQGKGRDIPSDEPSHTGWAMDFYKFEY